MAFRSACAAVRPRRSRRPRRELPANLCPLIKSTFGYHIEGSNPFLEMADLVVAETTCDGKKKMYELMAEQRPMYVLELPQKVDDADALAHWVAELRKFRAFLENRFQVAISDDGIREAIVDHESRAGVAPQLAALMATDRPPLTGRQLLKLKSSISGIPWTSSQYERASGVCSAGSSRVAKGRRRVRVLMTGVPMVARGRTRARPHRGKRRPGRRHGELHGPETDAGRCRCRRRRTRSWRWPTSTSTCRARS